MNLHDDNGNNLHYENGDDGCVHLNLFYDDDDDRNALFQFFLFNSL